MPLATRAAFSPVAVNNSGSIGNTNDSKVKERKNHSEPYLCARWDMGCSLCTVHSCTLATYVGTTFPSSVTPFSTHLHPKGPNSSSERQGASGLRMNELIGGLLRSPISWDLPCGKPPSYLNASIQKRGVTLWWGFTSAFNVTKPQNSKMKVVLRREILCMQMSWHHNHHYECLPDSQKTLAVLSVHATAFHWLVFLTLKRVYLKRELGVWN